MLILKIIVFPKPHRGSQLSSLSMSLWGKRYQVSCDLNYRCGYRGTKGIKDLPKSFQCIRDKIRQKDFWLPPVSYSSKAIFMLHSILELLLSQYLTGSFHFLMVLKIDFHHSHPCSFPIVNEVYIEFSLVHCEALGGHSKVLSEPYLLLLGQWQKMWWPAFSLILPAAANRRYQIIWLDSL